MFDDNTVYAVHDNQYLRPDDKKTDLSGALSKNDFKNMSSEEFLQIEDKKLNSFLRTNGFQEKYRADNVKQMVRSGAVAPVDLAKYLEDANAMLFDTPVIGAEVFRSDNGGKTWTKTHDDYLDGVFFSYGYYFAQIAVDPNNKNKVYVGGVPIIKSPDGGKTWVSINRENVHVDHHSIWVNPNKEGHIINGNDGGLNISYDDGETWIKNNSIPVGQFYAINIDYQKPYNVYGGLQDNGVWMGAHNAPMNREWHQEGAYPWKSIIGGDGMQIQIDKRNPSIIYTGFQFGNYYRFNLKTGERTYIQPKHQLGESPYRFNWQTPILLSPHNQDIVYFGSNKLHRSLTQGNEWTAISGDLTNGGKKGNVAYGTLTSISESPFEFGLIYTGSDDGMVHVTRDGGANWQLIYNSFPNELWVSRVIASQHKKERVYVTLNGYRFDDFNTYIFKSEDYGKTWDNIKTNIPASPVNVIKEDPENEQVLYVGTDNGAYISFDMGESWNPFSKGLPNVAIHDLVIQPEAKDLLLGTHGRSIYKANIAPLQKMKAAVQDQVFYPFEIDPVRHSNRWGNTWNRWSEAFEPSSSFTAYASQDNSIKITVYSEDNIALQTFTYQAEKGFNYISYDLSISTEGKNAYNKRHKNAIIDKVGNGKMYLPKGKYTVEFVTKGSIEKRILEVK